MDQKHSLPTTISNVFMEFFNVNGTGLLIHSDSYNNPSQISFTETSGILRELPNNLCDFPGLLTINVSHNKISSLQPMSCLTILDTFNASHNRLMLISNNTFTGMAALRVVDLSYNSIVVIEPNTFTQDQLHILKINVANNNLREVDFTNVMLEHKYCYVNYENNQIHDIVNQLNYTFDIDEGFVNISTSGIWYFTNNSLSRFLDPAKLGLPSILYFAFLKNIWLRLRENPIYCDCSMYPLLKGLIDGLKSRLVKLDAEFLGCVLPSHLSYL